MIISCSQILLGLALGVGCYTIWKLLPYLLQPYTSALKNLPGPPSRSWLYGNINEMDDADFTGPQEKWASEYGRNLVYKGFLSNDILWTTDTRALNHILTHSTEYQKPEPSRRALAKVLGDGLLSAEADRHRRQRRVMNPAFGPSQIRELTATFVQKSIELRDAWDARIAQEGRVACVDAFKGLTLITLDIIGLAGFNYHFNALRPDEKPNELYEAFREISTLGNDISVLMVLQSFLPALEIIPDERSRRFKKAKAVTQRIGRQLIAQKKDVINRELASGREKANIGKNDLQGRDLLTLLLKANMATGIPDNQRLSDDDVLAQVPTFLAAGHETTSAATTWCIFALTQAPHVQKKLRAELYTIETDAPTMDALNSLPYLDAVVRETMRVHAPVPVSSRVATADDVIPLNEPFVDRFGQVQDSIRISKGCAITIPILALNRSEKVWGPDAHEFKPERWENEPAAAANVPGVWGHLLSFLGGPRACIGYRFSLVEMKALIFVLVRAFEFELAVPPAEIHKQTSVVQRPVLQSVPEQGGQLPVLIRRYVKE